MARKSTSRARTSKPAPKKSNRSASSRVAARKPAVQKRAVQKRPAQKRAKSALKPKKAVRAAKSSAVKPRASKPLASAAPDPSRIPLFRASLAVSLDGYIADTSGSVDWLNDYFSPEIDFIGFLRTIGATVHGRATFDWSLEQGHAGAVDPDAPGGKAIVLTHRPIENLPTGVETFSGDVRELAARLRDELKGSGKDVWLMGGGQSIAPFHEAGLVDRWELSIIPILLGNGIPLFPPHSRGFSGLRLVRSRTLSNGILEAWYEPDRR